MKRGPTFVFVMSLLPCAALGGTREDVLSGAVRCGGIANDRAWLDCFYGSAQPMRQQLGLPPAPPSQTALVPAMSAQMPQSERPLPKSEPAPPARPAAAASSSEGFWSRTLGGKVIVNQVAATSYSFDQTRHITVTLSNGQIWRQQDDEQSVRWNQPATHYLVTIREGALGSYNLSVPDTGGFFKVRRVR
jgi:hypothetical protein